jgi:acyl transferase domain-containing protein/acyl carrier protein
LNETWITQPALFAVEYAAARMWQRCGIEPAAMLGHSVGEYVAACLAGVMTLEDALRLVAARGALIQSMPAGAMLAIPLTEDQVRPLLTEGLSIAAVNAHHQTVASGPIEEIAALEAVLTERKTVSKRLRTSHAFHSAMLEPAIAQLTAEAGKITLRAPQIPYLSNVTGTWITAEEAISPAYWGRHMRSAVRFADGLDALLERSNSVMLEAGPGESLISLLRQHYGKSTPKDLISTTRHPSTNRDDREHWLDAAGRLWLAGAEMDGTELRAGENSQRVSLPTYPFERQRYWIEPIRKDDAKSAATEDSDKGRKRQLPKWFYVPSWKRSAPLDVRASAQTEEANTWLFFADDSDPLLEPLLHRLGNSSARVIRVKSGTEFAFLDEASYIIDPAVRGHYTELLRHLLDDGLWPERVLHGWACDSTIEESEWDRGLFSVMYLAQAIADVSSSRDVAMYVVTARGQDVLGEQSIDAKAAALTTFCKVIPLENANISCKVIDIHPGTASRETITGQLADELRVEPRGEVVAWRFRSRWTEEHEPLDTSAQTGSAIKICNRGVYLITGGLGGAGLVLAQHLARKAQARLVLTTRSEFPPEAEWEQIAADASDERKERTRAFQQIRAAGGEVHIFQVDSCDRQAMRAVLDTVRSSLGPIRGVLHAAGLGSSTMIHGKSRDEVWKVLAPKTRGCDWIPDVLTYPETDFVLLFSSISSVVPGIGLSDYGAANSYLDAFAAIHDREDGTRVLSVNWDRWSDAGMAADSAHSFAFAAQKEAVGEGITNREAEEVFDRVLARPLTRTIVSTRHLQTQLAKTAGVHELLKSAMDPSAGLKVELHSRPELSQEFAEPTDETERSIAAIWQDLLGVDRVGAHDNFFELGGHSLLGIQVMARIRERFGVDLPLRTVFETPTPAEFAQLIRAIPWASGAGAATVDAGSMDREEIEI